MTRLELLQLVVAHARSNGFEFRRWYTARMGLPWISAEASIRLLDTQRRYYALLFSHEFASSFWKSGSEITFEMPASSFERRMPDGSIRVIKRKPFMRRTARPDVWRYHLQKMALADQPLRYLRKYLRVEDDLDPEPDPAPPPRPRGRPRLEPPTPPPPLRGRPPASRVAAAKRTGPRPLPPGPPAFLKRPYPGTAQNGNAAPSRPPKGDDGA